MYATALSLYEQVSRMGASLLFALGFPSLVARTSEEYEELGTVVMGAAAERAVARKRRAAAAAAAAAAARLRVQAGV